MENKLEQLLNSLIKRWRVPFGESRIEEINRAEQYVWNWNWCCWGGAMQKRKSTRQLVSKESGLWQFVCENGMVELDTESWENDSYLCYYNVDGYPKDNYFEMERDDYRFRLIESALKDESELEQFLLDNIKL